MTENKEKLFEDMRAKPHISNAQIETYLTCPLKYRFQYIDRIEWKHVPSALSFGSAIHETLNVFYHALKNGETLPMEKTVKIFGRSWKAETEARSVSFRENEDFDSVLELGSKMIEAFCVKAKPQQIIAIEEPFSVLLADFTTGETLDLPLIGKIDLIEQDSQGNLVVVDTKTAARRYSDSRIADDLQMTCYAYNMAKNGYEHGDTEVLLRFDVLLKTKEPDFIHYFTVRDENDYLFLFKLAREVRRGVQAGVFFPNKGWYCPDCPFKNECQEW